MKVFLLVLGFIAILGSLGSALYFMMRPGGDGKPRSGMARALALRVGFSVVLFLCVLAAWKFGWINPTGLPLKQ